MLRRFDHIDLRVPRLAEVAAFYEALLPALGFTRRVEIEGWLQFESGEGEVGEFFGVTESPGHVPNENRIAFWAESVEEVERIAEVARTAASRLLSILTMSDPYPEDTREMKARGYDPATIAEAEECVRRRAEGAKLCPMIEAAFSGVTLGNGIGLEQARALDDREDASIVAAYRACDEKEDWRRIPAEKLCALNDTLSFFDAEGMRFHLPAFLIADLRGEYERGLAFTLTHRGELEWERFRLLSVQQRRAVRAYLLHVADDPDKEFSRADILQALEEYWTDAP
jgi:catechol 2,3-dioxygenase-like lactoylglutathione lyase family enzyme